MLARLSIENNLQIIQDGLPAARQAAVFSPEDPQPIVLIGRAYLLMDQPLLAERFLIEAIELDPDLPDPHYYLGILYLNTSQSSSAEFHLQITRALAQSSGDPIFSPLAEKLLKQYFP
jgi:tetratricopeptide (TPR) repeat protein